MNWKNLFDNENEKPLDTFINDGGFTGIFRTMAFVGDSLSSGEFESMDKDGNKGYHDMFEYSWGQYIARTAGLKAYNFSRGGMTAKVYCEEFADTKGYWADDKLCQAYVIALGANDITSDKKELGNISDINIENWRNNKKTFIGYYSQIIQRYKEMQPRARFFLMTLPRNMKEEKFRIEAGDIHAELMYKLAEIFTKTYVLDFRKYAPEYNDEFRSKFMLGGHMNAMGYMFTSKMVMSYIDYIIRHNPEEFFQVPFIGTDLYNSSNED